MGRGVTRRSETKRGVRDPSRRSAGSISRRPDGRVPDATVTERRTESEAVCRSNHNDLDRRPDYGTEHVH